MSVVWNIDQMGGPNKRLRDGNLGIKSLFLSLYCLSQDFGRMRRWLQKIEIPAIHQYVMHLIKKMFRTKWRQTLKTAKNIMQSLVRDMLGWLEWLYVDDGVKASFVGPLNITIGLPSFHYVFEYTTLDGPEPESIKEILNEIEVLQNWQRAILAELKHVIDSPLRSVLLNAQRLHTPRRETFLKVFKDLVKDMTGKKKLIAKAVKLSTQLRKI